MKTTRKGIYRIYGKENVISLGYCKIQSIKTILQRQGTPNVQNVGRMIFTNCRNHIIIQLSALVTLHSERVTKKRAKCANDGKNYIITTIIRSAKEWLNALRMNCTKQLITANMFCVMLLLFGVVLFISGTDIERLRNYKDESDKF